MTGQESLWTDGDFTSSGNWRCSLLASAAACRLDGHRSILRLTLHPAAGILKHHAFDRNDKHDLLPANRVPDLQKRVSNIRKI